MAGGGSVGVGIGSGVGDGIKVGVLIGVGSTGGISTVGGGVLANEGVQASRLNRYTVVRKRSLVNRIMLNSVGGMVLL